jgi:hypothetical protein
MTQLFKTLTEGTPLEMHNQVFEFLDGIVETYLQEQRKIVVSKMFGSTGDGGLQEKVQRKPWTKETIREALEAAASNKFRQPINENYSKISHMHKIMTDKGFNHVSSYPLNKGGEEGHMNVYKHPAGHSGYIHTNNDYQLITGSGSHLEGHGHTTLSHHLKNHMDSEE